MEAFFGSLKRDYAAHCELVNAARAAALVPTWIAHYNRVAPHSALAMRALAEAFARFLQTQPPSPE